jgi:hypothetical protein
VVDGDLVSVEILGASPLHLQGELVSSRAWARRGKGFDNPAAPIYDSPNLRGEG